MPKIKHKKPGEMINDLINYYMVEQGISSDRLGQMFGCSGQNIRAKKSRGCEKFTLIEFKAWCKRLGIPPEVSANVLQQYLEK